MAASVSSNYLGRDNPTPLQTCAISGLEPNVDVDITSKGPSGVAPIAVWYTATTDPTDKSAHHMTWTASDTSADTFTVRFHSQGSLSGLEVKVYAEFPSAASGGIS